MKTTAVMWLCDGEERFLVDYMHPSALAERLFTLKRAFPETRPQLVEIEIVKVPKEPTK